MDITEKELQDHIFQEKLIDLSDSKFRDFVSVVEKEFRIGNERIDLLGVGESGYFYVIELKKGVIDGNAHAQVINYSYSLQNLLNFNDIKYKGIRAILIGNGISDRVQNCITGSDFIEYIKFELNVELSTERREFKSDFYKNLSDQALKAGNHMDRLMGSSLPEDESEEE